MWTWILQLESMQPNGGTVTAVSTTGTAPEGEKAQFSVTATPRAGCGWSFHHWSVGTNPSGMRSASGPNPLLTTPQSITGVAGQTITIIVRAIFQFSGTGKILRSSLLPNTLLTSGGRLIIDS